MKGLPIADTIQITNAFHDSYEHDDASWPKQNDALPLSYSIHELSNEDALEIPLSFFPLLIFLLTLFSTK
jgi:hypothetical protein